MRSLPSLAAAARCRPLLSGAESCYLLQVRPGPGIPGLPERGSDGLAEDEPQAITAENSPCR